MGARRAESASQPASHPIPRRPTHASCTAPPPIFCPGACASARASRQLGEHQRQAGASSTAREKQRRGGKGDKSSCTM
ncbi:hypothetical protein BDY21DRAFT_330842, partial [Lineolata rhizophorae]